MRGKKLVVGIVPITTFLGGYFIGLALEQAFAVSIAAMVISTTLLMWKYRLSASVAGLSIAFLTGILPFKLFLEYSHMDIILFLLGMMTIVGYLEENHYFEYLVSKMIPVLHGKPKLFIIVMMFTASFFAAVVDEVTAILFMSVIMLELSAIYQLDIRRMILPITFAVIIGGSATVMGNPVAILVAFRGGLTMQDFAYWATPITLVSLVILSGMVMLLFRDEIKKLEENMSKVKIEEIVEALAEEVHATRKATVLFVLVIGSIILHNQIATLISSLGAYVTPKVVLVSIALLGASVILATEGEDGIVVFLHRVDWQTLVFLLSFFSIVGSLDHVGVLQLISNAIVEAAGGNEGMMFLYIAGITGVLSPVMDNVLTVATLSPIVEGLGEMGVNTIPIWFGMLFAGIFSALATPIGTSASLVMMGLLERRRVKLITFGEWIRVGLPAAIIILGLALTITYFRAYGMPV